jgi:type VI secretion system protein ImpJ
MKRQSRVVWAKGRFLSPQHFQAQDLYFEDLIQSRFSASHFANYGVTDLQIDADSVANGLFKVVGARGVLPDGESFDMPGSDELPASRQLAPNWPASEETLDVYLSLPERRLNARNVTLAGQQDGSGPADTRYTSDTILVPDENQGSDERPVQFGKKTFRLLFENEFRDGYSSLRIARLERSATGVPMLRPSFVAPCLDLASSDYLLSLLRRQVEILLTNSATLSGTRRETGKSSASFSASEIDKFWLLHTFNSHLPELKHIYKTRRGHPEPAFVAMLRLAGALSTFAQEGGPGNLPDYDHDDLGSCFQKLDARIRELMATLIPENFVAIPLVFTDRYIWAGSVEDDTLFKKGQFYLSVSAKMGVGDIITKVPHYLKIATPDDLDRLVRTAVSGVGLRHAPVVPQAVPTKLENQYFQINQTGPLWERIMMTRRIGVHAPGEIVDPKMEIVVVWE